MIKKILLYVIILTLAPAGLTHAMEDGYRAPQHPTRSAPTLLELCIDTYNRNSVQINTKKDRRMEVTPYGQVIMQALQAGPVDLKSKIIAGIPDENAQYNPHKGLTADFVALKNDELCQLIESMESLSIEDAALLIDRMPQRAIDGRLSKLIIDHKCPAYLCSKIVQKTSAAKLINYFKGPAKPQRKKDKKASLSQENASIDSASIQTIASQIAQETQEKNDSTRQHNVGSFVRNYILFFSAKHLLDAHKELLRQVLLQKLKRDIQSRVIIIEDLNDATQKEADWVKEHGELLDSNNRKQWNRAIIKHDAQAFIADITNYWHYRTAIKISNESSLLISLSIPHGTYTRIAWNQSGTRLILESKDDNGDYHYQSTNMYSSILTGTLNFEKTLVCAMAFEEGCLKSNDARSVEFQMYQTIYDALLLQPKTENQLEALLWKLTETNENKPHVYAFANALINYSYGTSAQKLLEWVTNYPKLTNADLIKKVCEKILALEKQLNR